MSPEPTSRSRREVLRFGLLAAASLPLTACLGNFDDGPDPLIPLADRAAADSAAAADLGSSASESAGLAKQAAEIRSAHLTALQHEIDRENRPKHATTPPDKPKGVAGLQQSLALAREQAEALVPTLPAYRAGLVAAVAAGCAAVQQLSPQLGPGVAPEPLDPASTTAVLLSDAVDPVQKALAAEHAAVWTYRLVSAFLPGNYANGVETGAAEHRDRRDVCARLLSSAGATPVPPEPAYLPPKPVTDARSAMSLVGIAEADSAAAWRGVIERTEDPELRRIALRALLSSARRGTRWRDDAGEKPAAIALPGSPT